MEVYKEEGARVEVLGKYDGAGGVKGPKNMTGGVRGFITSFITSRFSFYFYFFYCDYCIVEATASLEECCCS